MSSIDRAEADRILDLAQASRDEARAGTDDAAWLALVAAVYELVQPWEVAG